MTVFPVFGPSSGRAYQTLAQGLAEGAVEVAERAQPTVPELELRHRGAVPVFILEGEEVVGGQQNRIVNLSMLVAPHTTIQLPVSCVEQGRWNRRTVRFHAGEAAFYDLRKERYTSGRKDAGGRPWLAQDAVWRTVAARDAALGVYSPSTAMHDQYQVRAQDLGLYDRVFPYPADALGLVVALNGRLAGAEIFAGPSLAAALWAKLIRSYAMDAASEPSAPVVRDRAIRLLNRVAGANVEGFPAVALGENLRFTGNGVAGAALLLDDEVVHVSVFRVYET
jgi:hypothetical protein